MLLNLKPVGEVLNFDPRDFQLQFGDQALLSQDLIGIELQLRLTVFSIDGGDLRLLRHVVAFQAHA